ncbi:hypothetical protein SAMN05428959_10354 [Duganella sp. CF517]|uniref:hypothetical protein n=1 Tax=Duganella sp. CF517 TaxID=1881038 RepID=UPI0008BEE1CC|nr:hypothetical protein [Duganella sp. CF517]SEN77299.1 hypothetical protein SAMN05428959_10354 [Duganella sp. CF517]
MHTIDIALRDDEGRLVIEALAELPFKTVFELIGDLNRQAVDGAGPAGAGGRRYQVDRDSLELMLRALAQLPYERVHRLLAALRLQLTQPQGGAE